jgi:positive regulator of sigma E activity
MEKFLVSAANFIWGTPLLILLLGGVFHNLFKVTPIQIF